MIRNWRLSHSSDDEFSVQSKYKQTQIWVGESESPNIHLLVYTALACVYTKWPGDGQSSRMSPKTHAMEESYFLYLFQAPRDLF